MTGAGMIAFDFAPFDRMVATALPRWGMGPAARAQVINHSENITYRVDDGEGGRWILRLHRPGYHSDAAIASELAWLEALRGAGVVRTAAVRPGRDEALVQTLRSEEIGETRRAVMFHFLDGTEPEAADIGGSMAQLGEVTARLHAHARRWVRPTGFERLHWDFDHMLGARPIWGDWRAAPGVEGEVKALLERLAGRLEQRLARFGSGAERRGLIHADLRAANLLVGGPEVAVIDFDDCGIGWYLYDYATTMTFVEDAPEVPEWTAAWVDGYRRAGVLSAEEEAELSTFLLLRRMMAVAWVGSHGETELAQSLGAAFTLGTSGMAERYLRRMG